MSKSFSVYRKIISTFTILFVVYSLQAQQPVIVCGNAKTYAGDRLSIYTKSDYITKQNTYIAACMVDSAGNFEMKFYPEYTQAYYLPLGVFEGILYASPGDTIVPVLPQKIIPSKADSLNPYFKPQQHYLRNLHADEDDLTEKIRAFEKQYFQESEHIFKDFRGRVNPLVVDSAVMHLEKAFPSARAGFFTEYKSYRYVSLRHVAYQSTTDKFVKKAFSNAPVLYQNPAYNEALWISVGFILEASDMRALSDDEKKQSLWRVLNRYMAEKPEYQNERFREYALLMNLYRMAFKSPEKRDRFIELFQEVQKLSQYEEHQAISERIVQELSDLQNGKPAPDFQLKDHKSIDRQLSDFAGEFLYLNFFSPDSYTGKKELALLDALHKEKLPGLTIVTVYVGKDYKAFKNFVDESGFSYEFLFAPDTAEILENYRVVSYPQYYLISPSGIMTMISAPGPANDFRSVYGPFYLEWNREQIRRKSKGDNSLINGNN